MQGPFKPYGLKLRGRLVGAALALAAIGAAPLAPWATAEALAAERGEAMLYVLEHVDQGGVVSHLIVPLSVKALTDAGPATRPMKAFEALRARSSKEYGATTLHIDSDTKARLVLDKVADADQVLAEVYWTLAAQGFTELVAPPYVKDAVTPEKLSYGAAVSIWPIWELLRFYAQPSLAGNGFAYVGGQLQPAAEVLKRLIKGDPALKKALADALVGPALRPKLAILEAISAGKSRDALRLKADDAVPALEDPSPAVRTAALDAIISAGIGGSKNVLAALDKLVEGDADTETKLRAVKELAKAGVNKYADLLESEKLKTGTAREAMEAVERLGKSTQVKIAGPALVAALSHSDRGVRDAAFKALVDLQQYDLLHQAMKGDMLSAEMREQIGVVLVEKGSPAAQDDALQYLLTKAKAPGKILACQTHGKRGTRAAIPALIDALKDDSAEVRGAAAEALALLKDERSITPLADAAEARARDKETMLKAASEILASLTLEKVKTLVTSKNVTVRQMAIRALAEFAKGSRPRPDVVAILQEARKDADINIKRSAVYALARLQDDGIARDLAEMKKDADGEIRVQVAIALANASEKYSEAAAVLEELMSDTDRRVKVEAIRGLGKRKAASALKKLISYTSQPDPEVKRAVYDTLLILRSSDNAAELRPVFQKGMNVNDSQVRSACITALAEKTALADFEALRLASNDNNKAVRIAAIAALAQVKVPEVIEVLSSFIGDADMEVREKTIEALCSIPGGEAAKTKKDALKSVLDLPDTTEPLKKKASQCLANP